MTTTPDPPDDEVGLPDGSTVNHVTPKDGEHHLSSDVDKEATQKRVRSKHGPSEKAVAVVTGAGAPRRA